MRKLAAVLVTFSVLGCATPRPEVSGPVTVVASPYEPAAQLGGVSGSAAEGAVIGAAGGAGIGALSAKASAGLLCTLGGPLCWVVMLPAAIVGGVVGGLAGGVADALTSGPSDEVVAARDAINQAVADMRLTETLASYITEENPEKNPEAASPFTLEVEVTGLDFLAREKDMALSLRARARLYRTADGALLDERFAEARTRYRKYEDWAADQAQPLRRALDEAVARLGRKLSPA